MAECDQQLHCDKQGFYELINKKGEHLLSKITQVKAKFPCIPHLMVDQAIDCHQSM